MPEEVPFAAPTIASRIRRAALRVVPVLLVAGGIAWWSHANAIRCERLFEGWAAEFERSLAAGDLRLPPSSPLADPVLAGPVDAALAAGAAARPASARIELTDRSGFARVSWPGRAEVARWIELRCDGATVVVSGVGVEPAASEGAEEP
ncbi:MAG: hypothetical protein ACO3ZY_04110 [Phycisphaerales bacterium]